MRLPEKIDFLIEKKDTNMCLAVVGTVVQITGDVAVADVEGNRLKVRTVMVREVKIGDHVLLHAGFAISIVSPREFKEHRETMKEVADHARRALERN